MSSGRKASLRAPAAQFRQDQATGDRKTMLTKKQSCARIADPPELSRVVPFSRT